MVASNRQLCAEHFRLILRVDRGFPPTKPGHFIQLLCRDVDLNLDVGANRDAHDSDLLQHNAFLRRPFSLAGRRDLPDGSTELYIIHRVVGVGTDWLSHRRTGDPISMIGPLGNTFTLPATTESAILIGGGVGIPPMIYLAEALAAGGISAVAFCGALSRDLLPLTVRDDERTIDEFAAHDIECKISTDDGSFGFQGFVTGLLEEHLDRTRAANAVLFTCGPEPMMKRIAQLGAMRGLAVQIAVERAMACGMGTCQSCCIRAIDDRDPDGWRYKLACTDGPIFAADQLLW